MKIVLWNATNHSFLIEILVCSRLWYGPSEMAHSYGSHLSLLGFQLSCKGKFCCNYKSRAKPSGSAKQHGSISWPFLSHSIFLDSIQDMEQRDSSHPAALGSSHLVSSMDSSPQNPTGEPLGSGITGVKGNNNSPCHVNKVTHLKILPLTPLPPVPQAMFREWFVPHVKSQTQF